MVSGSYTQQEATSFRPRVDRDGGLVENVNATVVRSGVTENQPTRRPAAQDFDFVGIQFLNQELENFEYETKNFAGTLEWAPSDHVKFYFDTIYNDQQRRQDSSRVQGSGVNALLDYSVPTSFQTVDFGSLDGVKLGSIRVAETGTIEPNIAVRSRRPQSALLERRRGPPDQERNLPARHRVRRRAADRTRRGIAFDFEYTKSRSQHDAEFPQP